MRFYINTTTAATTTRENKSLGHTLLLPPPPSTPRHCFCCWTHSLRCNCILLCCADFATQSKYVSLNHTLHTHSSQPTIHFPRMDVLSVDTSQFAISRCWCLSLLLIQQPLAVLIHSSRSLVTSTHNFEL